MEALGLGEGRGAAAIVARQAGAVGAEVSGGSYDYAYSKIEELADNLRLRDNPRRAVLKKILKLAADAAHRVEWVDSGDSSPGDEDVAIDDLIKALNGDPETQRKAAAYDEILRWMDKGERHGS